MKNSNGCGRVHFPFFSAKTGTPGFSCRFTRFPAGTVHHGKPQRIDRLNVGFSIGHDTRISICSHNFTNEQHDCRRGNGRYQPALRRDRAFADHRGCFERSIKRDRRLRMYPRVHRTPGRSSRSFPAGVMRDVDREGLCLLNAFGRVVMVSLYHRGSSAGSRLPASTIRQS